MRMRLWKRGTHLLLLASCWLALSSGQEAPEGSFATSMFSSLFKTLASSNESPLCPGRCFNGIAAMACRKVLDKPNLCKTAGYRCCSTEAEEEAAQLDKTPSKQIKAENTQSGLEQEVVKPVEDPVAVNTISQVDSALPEASAQPEEIPSEIPEVLVEETKDTSQNKENPIESSQSSAQKATCPGVCVANRISSFCEAVIDAYGLCEEDLRCCVASNLFDGVENPPREFRILKDTNEENEKPPNPESGAKAQEATSSSTMMTTHAPATFVSTTTTTTSQTLKTTETTSTVGTTPRSLTTASNLGSTAEEDDIPPEKRCKGTCVAGFFAFLCDSVDREGACPRNGRCCVTQRKRRPRPRPRPRPGQRPPQRTDLQGDKEQKVKEEEQDSRRPSTTSAVTTPSTTTTRRRTTTRRTTTAEPTTSRSTTKFTTEETAPPVEDLPKCPGRCLPESLASRCQPPASLMMASGCDYDEVCCDLRNVEPSSIRKPPRRPEPLPAIPSSLGSLFGSLFGGGPPVRQRRPPMPSRKGTEPPTTTSTTTAAPTTTTTTVPTTTTTTENPRPECRGTCIRKMFSFTCMWNAEMTDIFRCDDPDQQCCSPKSTIREYMKRNELTINARNDTVESEIYDEEGPYIHQPSHYVEQPPYDPQYIPHPPPYAHQEEQYNHNAYQPYDENYNAQSGLTHSYYQPPYQENPYAGYHEYQGAPPPPTDEFGQPVYQHHGGVQPEQEGVGQGGQHQQYPPSGQHPPHDYDQQGEGSNVPYTPHLYQESYDASTLTNPLQGDSFSKSKYVCGVKGTNRAGRVVGGEDSIPGEWCWQVSLINSLNQYLCGGALIGNQWVLTAAHCVTNIVRSGDAIYVRVGDHDLTTRFGSPGAQTIPVATTYIHHNHNSQTLDNDIALLKLSNQAELGNGVCLACLPARGVSQVAGKRCTVTGYGYMGEKGPIPLRVREAEIPVVSDQECVRKINAVTEKIFILPASSFCAGGESGHDACQGDGGGPLVCNVDGYFELSGLVSWGFGCGRADVPGVYVKVSSFIGWINQIISVNNL